jgi:hypothetical protein
MSRYHKLRLNMLRLSSLLLALSLYAQRAADLKSHHVEISDTNYRGRPAVRVLAKPDAINGESYAILNSIVFENGSLEVDLAGQPGPGATATARGFVGLAFRLNSGQYEYIYLRPTNGRAEDQIRRNHSTQYGAHPGYDFDRMRKEFPEKYESYVDLEPGVWTHVRIEVSGSRARLFVHRAGQPCLIVNDLKFPVRPGAVALWVGPGTEAHFANLQIKNGN